MPGLKLFFLGAPRIERDGRQVFVDTRKATALLAYLAVEGGDHTRDSLAAMFWPEAAGGRARAALRRTLSALKAATGGAGLDVERESLRVEEVQDIWVDVHEFQACLAECEQPASAGCQPSEGCLRPLEAAVELYRGDFLEGFTLRDSPAFDDWQFFQAESLRRRFAAALEKLACGYSERQEFETAIHYARRWVGVDPLREEAHQRLMLLYAEAGQRNAALRQYRECLRILEQELGVPPLDETTQLYQSILEYKSRHERRGVREPGGQGAREPEAPGPPPGLQPGLQSGRPQASLSASARIPIPPGALLPRLPLVGRSQETVALLRAYEKAASGGYFLALEGEAGIGKTRLAEEFLGYARSRGAIAVAGRSYEGEADLVYGPFIEALRSALNLSQSAARLAEVPAHWLAEAARLLPELADLAPRRQATPPLEGPGAQGRFLEGLTRTLLGLVARIDHPGYEERRSSNSGEDASGPPGVLFLDDLHLADAATLNLLSYLVRRLRGQALFVLVSWRKEGLAAGHPLFSLIADVQRAGVGGALPLSRLGPNHVADLVQAAAAAGLALPPGLEERLYREAEGLPFFVVEYLASLVEGANPEAGGEWAMPHSVRDLLRARLAAANETGWQLLTTAAVIGRSFDYEALRRSSGRGEAETIAGLEELLSLGLIQEHESRGRPAYDFHHEKLRALVYEETSLARRRLLHRRVAEALLEGARLRQETDAFAGQVARHYQLAGMEAQAAEYYRLAGEYARSLAANAEALAYFQAALAASASLLPQAGESRLRTAELYESIGDLQTLSGNYPAAAKSLQTAAALCEPECLARIEHKLGDLYRRLGDWELSESHYQMALDALAGQNPPGDRARLYADWALTALQREQGERALELACQALDLAQQAGDPRALAQAHNMLGILARHAEDFPDASRHLEESLALAEGLGDTGARVAALNNLALAYGDQGRLDEGRAATETALRLSVQQGDRHREAALHNNLADLLHRQGQSEQAMAHLKKAVVIFAEIGSDMNAASPEIWKLTEW